MASSALNPRAPEFIPALPVITYYDLSPPPPPPLRPYYCTDNPTISSYYGFYSVAFGHPVHQYWQMMMMMMNPPVLIVDDHHQISSTDRHHHHQLAAGAEVEKKVIFEEAVKTTTRRRSKSTVEIIVRSTARCRRRRPRPPNCGTFRAAESMKGVVHDHYSQRENRFSKPNSSSVMSSSTSGSGGGHLDQQAAVKPLNRRKLFLPAKPPDGVLEQIQHDGSKTTVMIKNIPSKYTREMLVQFLDNHCKAQNEKAAITPENPAEEKQEKGLLSSAFDFVYLPIDFKHGLNKGYAFVNFTNPSGVWKLYLVLNNYKWGVLNSNKICELTYARIQGKDRLVKHFERTYFECESEEFLPVYFDPPRDGCSGDQLVIKQSTAGKCVGCSLPSSTASNQPRL